jgi:hypothetical protein
MDTCPVQNGPLKWETAVVMVGVGVGVEVGDVERGWCLLFPKHGTRVQGNKVICSWSTSVK